LWESRDFSAVPELADPDFAFDLSRNVFNPAVSTGGSMASFARSIHIEKRRISAGTPLARPFPRIRTADLVSVRPLHPSYRPSMLASLRP